MIDLLKLVATKVVPNKNLRLPKGGITGEHIFWFAMGLVLRWRRKSCIGKKKRYNDKNKR
ncbi:hypothetical protein HYC85_023239 [Camellia sinensis]|uniref:Uncharacterized protein n=1 Tax=Camellia sinensis TaxID=4442 RepID=A0A7J7GE23_CAMSI|nr:hypothetical protein HYC85_023239 [Camellia sinensis]